MFDSKIYVITNRHLCRPKSLVEVATEILDVGVEVIQLREKDLDDVDLLKIAQPLSRICHSYNADLFINTHAKIAADVGASGIHIPDNDVSVEEVKDQYDSRLLVGCSIHTIETAKKREKEGADFITYSPIFDSTSKPVSNPAVGLGELQSLVRQVNLPVFALGGISPGHVTDCLKMGAYGVAVMSGIMHPIDSAKRAKAYLKVLSEQDSIY